MTAACSPILEQSPAVRDLALDGAEHHGSFLVGKAQRQHFRHEGANLARGKFTTAKTCRPISVSGA